MGFWIEREKFFARKVINQIRKTSYTDNHSSETGLGAKEQ